MRPAGKSQNKPGLKKLSIALPIAACLWTPGSAGAGPADKVYMPLVEVGELEFEMRGGYAKIDSGDDVSALVLDVGYGVSQRWFTEVAVEYEQTSGGSGEIEAVEWENVLQLTRQGQYWVDVGLFAKYEHKVESGAIDEIVVGPMFQKDAGAAQLNLNVLFEREIGSGSASEIETGYAAQAKWRGNPAREFGFQAFGEEDNHRVGPAMFGSYRLDNGDKFKFDTALLLGVTEAAPDVTLRFQLEYEMR